MKSLEGARPRTRSIRPALCLLAITLLAWSGSTEARQSSRGDTDEAKRLTEVAVKKIEAGELVAAIDDLDLAIEADPE